MIKTKFNCQVYESQNITGMREATNNHRPQVSKSVKKDTEESTGYCRWNKNPQRAMSNFLKSMVGQLDISSWNGRIFPDLMEVSTTGMLQHLKRLKKSSYWELSKITRCSSRFWLHDEDRLLEVGSKCSRAETMETKERKHSG